MARLIGLLIGASSLFHSADAFAQDVLDMNKGAVEVECAADDIPCHIARMNRKPGSGGSGISTDKEIETILRNYDNNDLGLTRIPSEKLQLPKQQFGFE